MTCNVLCNVYCVPAACCCENIFPTIGNVNSNICTQITTHGAVAGLGTSPSTPWNNGKEITSYSFDHVWTSNIVFPTMLGRLIIVSDNNNISQLLRDSFSVSQQQQPPIWEPPSHYSMLHTLDMDTVTVTVRRGGWGQR